MRYLGFKRRTSNSEIDLSSLARVRCGRFTGLTGIFLFCVPFRARSFTKDSVLSYLKHPQAHRKSTQLLFADLLNGDQEEIKRVRDLLFVCPLLDEGYPPAVEAYENQTLAEKPLLVYLPGFDGTWLSPFLQLPELSTLFDVRCLSIGMKDRSTFDELKSDVINFIYETLEKPKRANSSREMATASTGQANVPLKGNFVTNLFQTPSTAKSYSSSISKQSNRPVYLAGESFGGILAIEVALSLTRERKLSNLKGLVLINAATCYDRSRLAAEGPTIAHLPKLLYPLGVMRLLPLFTDSYSFPQLLLIVQSKALPSVIDSAAREAYMGRVAFSLGQKLQFMPRETLRWRLEEWLDTGCARMEPKRLEKLAKVRMLIVAGEKDMTLPSIAEADRLSSMFPKSQVHVVDGAGHASTCGSRMDLAALIRNSFPELRRKKRSDRVAMKPAAAKGEGAYFGLEPRYNGKEEGLSPLLYWSKALYRKPPTKTI